MKASANQVTACAPPTVTTDWHQINWSKCNVNVKRLQARIVKATQEGRWGKVKSLQYLLTHSFSGKALAVKRVTENQGKRTPGVDGKTWSTPVAKSQAISSLKRRGYKPQPLRRVYIPKANGKRRPLSIPTMKDRAMQALHLLALEPVAETTADPNSYGFRSERSCQDAIEQCFNNHRFNWSSAWVIECDINGCFDNISQKWMLTHIPTDKVILQKWLKAGFIEKHSFFPTEAGTPQGGVISPVLANMTLDGLEGILRKYFPHHKKPKKNIYKVNIVRYADDFVITGTSKELLENEVMPLVKTFLVERGLELSSEKTRITHIEEGYDFLGKTVRKYNGKLLIKPSEKSINTFLRNVRAIIKENKALDQVKLIKRLNPIIRGWAEYHKHDVSKRVFGKVNSEIWRALWRWAKRRHPRKGRGWILRKYFHRIGSRSWVFAVPEKSCELFDPRCIKIKRHVKIAAEANPFDPKWEEYFEKRIDLKMKDSIGRKKSLLSLWRSQDGICPTCNQKITKESGWNNHHITWKSKGGRRGNSNRVLLHPNCHRQVHNQGIKVVKPAPRKRGKRKA